MLQHGTSGFTSPPKEGVLRIFIALKNSSPAAGFAPAKLDFICKHANYYTIEDYIQLHSKTQFCYKLHFSL
jgi:hypothetical protein